MTNSWNDIKNADVVLVMGGNPAENHPCGFKWALKAREQRGAKIVCIDPRFTRTAAVSDLHVPIRSGSDIAFMGGLINYVLSTGKYQKEYVAAYTNAAFLVKDTSAFDPQTGLFSGYDADKRKYDQTLWDVETDDKKMVKSDPTLTNPRCAINVMKTHYSRYTPEMVERITGVSKDNFLKVAEMIASTGAPDKVMTHLYALGWTEHSFGTQLIGSMAILQLLLGNIGMPGGGINALRGHGNVQGVTDLCAVTANLPGYLKAPKAEWKTLKEYLEANTPKPNHDHSMNYYGNTPKFVVSLLKAWWGAAATKENDFAYDFLPKYDKPIAWNGILDNMYNGKIDGLFIMGANVINNGPNTTKTARGLAKLKWLVVDDIFKTESVEFWKADPSLKPEAIQTEILVLPGVAFGEKDGTFAGSGRLVKWRWKGADPPGDAKDEKWMFGNLYTRLKALYLKEGGAFPEPVTKLAWGYKNAAFPTSDEVLAEINGYALGDLFDDKKVQIAKKGERVPNFGALKDDGSTSCGMWIYSGIYPQAGNKAQATGGDDPSGLGVFPNYAFSWPANRRVLYNRASADPSGKPWDPKRKYLWWNELDKKWVGVDVPDIKPDLPPETGPFIMLPEGVGRLYAPQLADGPLPEFYEPFESPVPNALHPKTNNNPIVKVYKSEVDKLGTPDKFPYVAITHRLTEHYHFFTKHMYGPSRAMPHMFVEIPEELGKEKGIGNGDYVKVSSARGSIKALALVTKRIKPLICDGKKVYNIGIPIHWGYEGMVTGGIANMLTPFIWDPNSSTPEFKGFLCNIEKASGGES